MSIDYLERWRNYSKSHTAEEEEEEEEEEESPDWGFFILY